MRRPSPLQQITIGLLSGALLSGGLALLAWSTLAAPSILETAHSQASEAIGVYEGILPAQEASIREVARKGKVALDEGIMAKARTETGSSIRSARQNLNERRREAAASMAPLTYIGIAMLICSLVILFVGITTVGKATKLDSPSSKEPERQSGRQLP